MIVYSSLERTKLAMLGEIEKLVAAEHALRMRHEGEKQIIYPVRRRDRLAGLADELALAGAQYPVSERVSIGVRRFHAVVGSAAKNRLDPRDQLARTERLGHIIVRAELEADDAVGFLDLGRQQDHRHLARGADEPGQRQ